VTRFFLFICISTLLMACGQTVSNKEVDKSLLPKSSGKYGEVLVVLDTSYESKKTGEMVRKIFNQMMPALPQAETQFRMSTVHEDAFKSILKRSRNILKLIIAKKRKAKIDIERDVWAKNQLLIQITASSDQEASEILEKNLNAIRAYFNEEEIDRLIKQYKIRPEKDLINELREKYNISLTIPPGFVLMDQSEKGFWIKKEKRLGEHLILQGVSVYKLPYTNDSLFDSKAVIDSRDKFTRKHIQGSLEGSYMAVYSEYELNTTDFNWKNNYVKEYRGLWNMKNDFMGGPFVHYAIVDTNRNEIIHLDGFVYAPKFNKREYLRELEALIRTVSFSTD